MIELRPNDADHFHNEQDASNELAYWAKHVPHLPSEITEKDLRILRRKQVQRRMLIAPIAILATSLCWAAWHGLPSRSLPDNRTLVQKNDLDPTDDKGVPLQADQPIESIQAWMAEAQTKLDTISLMTQETEMQILIQRCDTLLHQSEDGIRKTQRQMAVDTLAHHSLNSLTDPQNAIGL